MYALVTLEQLEQDFTPDMLTACGYTPEVMEAAGKETVCLRDVTIPIDGRKDHDPEEAEPGKFKVSLSVAGVKYFIQGRLVATRRPNAEQIAFWKSIGVEVIE